MNLHSFGGREHQQVCNRLVDDMIFQTITGHSSDWPNTVTAYETYHLKKYIKTCILNCKN
jgi:hypothetical protein